jgi:hypothetical protein
VQIDRGGSDDVPLIYFKKNFFEVKNGNGFVLKRKIVASRDVEKHNDKMIYTTVLGMISMPYLF